MSPTDLGQGEHSSPGDVPPACCLPQCLPCNQATLYLGAAGKMLFLWWHFLPLGCQKQRLFRYQASYSWIREKNVPDIELEGCIFYPGRIFYLKGQGHMGRLDEHNFQFHCDDYSYLLVIYNSLILSRSNMVCEVLYNRKLWNKSMRESRTRWNNGTKNKSSVRLIQQIRLNTLQVPCSKYRFC